MIQVCVGLVDVGERDGQWLIADGRQKPSVNVSITQVIAASDEHIRIMQAEGGQISIETAERGDQRVHGTPRLCANRDNIRLIRILDLVISVQRLAQDTKTGLHMYSRSLIFAIEHFETEEQQGQEQDGFDSIE